MVALTLYRTGTLLAGPAIRMLLRRRSEHGKEDRARLAERWGRSSLPRPAGPLSWVHAVSVGETMSALPLIAGLLDARPRGHVLLTTATISAARLAGVRLPTKAFHQYLPVDLPGAVNRFLDHWRPDLAVFVESELWPNLILAASRRGIALTLVNGRMTDHTYRRWRRWPGLIEPVLGSFDRVLARSEQDAARLTELGARAVGSVGDLKYATATPPVDETELLALRAQIAGRPVWLAASTHEGEEEIAADVHRRLAKRHPGMLTVIVPRHPERGPLIAAKIAGSGVTVGRRAANETINPETAIYIADTLGELGLFYRLARIAFVGGSLVPVGGHNLLEPARLGCTIVHGPHMSNFADMARAFRHAGAAVEVFDSAGLAVTVGDFIDEPESRSGPAEIARRLAEAEAGVLDRVMAEILPLWPPSPGPIS